MSSNSKTSPLPTSNFLEYHRPRLRVNRKHIPTLTRQSKQCLHNLASYHTPKLPLPLPRSRCAAVLVALFVGRAGDVYVLLSRRSATLRTYAGDTSLPGGKVDPGDKSFEDTARREAFEEIGLPRDRRKVPLLCILEPFIASNDLIVTPVVVLILDLTSRPILNTAEVTSLFSHPLSSFLDETPPFPHEPESLEVPYHTNQEWETEGPQGVLWRIRGHRFLTGREAGGIKPVVGLTAAILIRVAEVAFSRLPSFELRAPGEPTMVQRLAWAMMTRPVYRRAFEEEGMDVDWDLVRWLANGEREGEGEGEKGKMTTGIKEGAKGRTDTRKNGSWKAWPWIPRTSRSKL